MRWLRSCCSVELPTRYLLLLLEAAGSPCQGAECNPRRVLWSDLCRLGRKEFSNCWQSLVNLLPLTQNFVFTVLREADVDCLTLGQYMQPTKRHLKVKKPLIYRQRYGLYLAPSNVLFLNGGFDMHPYKCICWEKIPSLFNVIFIC